MQKVNIYIDVYHTGHLKYGTGTYNIVLEYISDRGPLTRQYYEGVNRTTANRTALIACIAALGHIVIPCEINITINSAYITQAINTNEWFAWFHTGVNAKGKPVKNMDLWQQLFELADKYTVSFTYAASNSYTSYQKTMAKKKLIEYKEDEGNV